MKCTKHRTDGEPCGAQAVAGTDACTRHAGRPLAEQKARGAVALEVSAWRIGDETMDPRVVLLRLMTQSYRRADLYGGLLEEAYAAAERLAAASLELANTSPSTLPGVSSSTADYDRASQDLQHIFDVGGVSALIGHTYVASGGDGGVFAASEAIRGLVQLEGQERDRAANIAAKAAAAKLGERQIELAEELVREFVDVIRGVLSDVGALLAAGEITAVDPSAPQVVRIVASRVRALPGVA